MFTMREILTRIGDWVELVAVRIHDFYSIKSAGDAPCETCALEICSWVINAVLRVGPHWLIKPLIWGKQGNVLFLRCLGFGLTLLFWGAISLWNAFFVVSKRISLVDLLENALLSCRFRRFGRLFDLCRFCRFGRLFDLCRFCRCRRLFDLLLYVCLWHTDSVIAFDVGLIKSET